MRPRQLQAAAPVERVGVEQRRRADQLVEQRVGLRLLRRPIREVLLGAEPGQLQPAHFDARLLKRLGDADAVVDAGAIIVGADDDLAHPQLDQCLRVFDAPLAGAVGVGGGEHAESSRRVDVLLALDDQQGCVRVRGEDGGDRRQIEQQRHPLRPAARPLFGGLVPHLAAEALLSRLRDVSGLRPGVASVGVLIGVADLLVRTVAADMRSRQAALFDQVVADGLEMLGVAVLRPAVKQDAARRR